jgi:hypothetical protein
VQEIPSPFPQRRTYEGKRYSKRNRSLGIPGKKVERENRRKQDEERITVSQVSEFVPT